MALQTAPRTLNAPAVGTRPDSGPSPKAAIGWLAGGAAVTFAVSWLGTTALGLHHDLYYLVYLTFALGYLGWLASRSRIGWRAVLRRNIWWSLGVGAVVAFAVARQIMSGDGTSHPGGGFYVFELAWRGVVYGTVDALTLFVFPAVVGYLVLRGDRRGLRRKAAFAGLVLLCSLVVSTSYHLGYSTYRGSEMSKPLIGTVMADVPAMLTGNPAGSIVAHATAHTTAVVHQYYGGEGTNRSLPPELTSSYADRPGGTAALGIAAGWVVVFGAVLAVNRRRIRDLL
jgi:hypothetical protein